MSDKLDLTVTLRDVTPAQAIALEAMFRHWQVLGAIGSSRWVAFFADGDGNFRPKVEVNFSEDPYPSADPGEQEALRKKAFPTNGEESVEAMVPVDFDAIAWSFHGPSQSPKVQAIKDHNDFAKSRPPFEAR